MEHSRKIREIKEIRIKRKTVKKLMWAEVACLLKTVRIFGWPYIVGFTSSEIDVSNRLPDNVHKKIQRALDEIYREMCRRGGVDNGTTVTVSQTNHKH